MEESTLRWPTDKERVEKEEVCYNAMSTEHCACATQTQLQAALTCT